MNWLSRLFAPFRKRAQRLEPPPKNKSDGFTELSRQVLTQSQAVAESQDQMEIGTEHVLIGLLRVEGGIAKQVLDQLGLDEAAMLEAMTQLSPVTPEYAYTVQMELRDDTKKMLEQAVAITRRHGETYVATEHMLLGMVQVPDARAVQVLTRLGVTPRTVIHTTRDLVVAHGGSPATSAEAVSTPPDPLDRLWAGFMRLWHADDPQAQPEPPLTDAVATLEAAEKAVTEGDYTRAASLYQRAYQLDPTELITAEGRQHDAVRLAARHERYVKIKRLSAAKHPVTLRTAWDDWRDFQRRFGLGYDPDDLATMMQATAQKHGFKDEGQATYSQLAQTTLRMARHAALGAQADGVQPEHLLLGVLLTSKSEAAQALQGAGLEPEAVMNALGLDLATLKDVGNAAQTYVGMDAAFMDVLGAARTIAEAAGEAVVDTGHLLAALLTADAPEVTRLLAEAGTTPEAIEAALTRDDPE